MKKPLFTLYFDTDSSRLVDVRLFDDFIKLDLPARALVFKNAMNELSSEMHRALFDFEHNNSLRLSFMRIKIDDDYGLFTIYILDDVLQIIPTERRFLFSFEEGLKVLADLELCISKAKKEIHLFRKGVQ